MSEIAVEEEKWKTWGARHEEMKSTIEIVIWKRQETLYDKFAADASKWNICRRIITPQLYRPLSMSIALIEAWLHHNSGYEDETSILVF